jgi:polyisoprenoid-binding protein YceI
MKKVICLLASCLLLAPAAWSAGNEWDIDTQHSSVTFTVRHMMISNVQGRVGGINGKIVYDGRNVDNVKVKCTIDPATINTGEPDRDKHLKTADFFDVAKFPTASFESTGVIPIATGGFKLGGNLTMHGVTKKVELSVDGPTQAFKDAKKGIEKIGAAATVKINRKDFGINYNKTLDNGGVAVGDEVKITIDLEASRNIPSKKGSK